MLHKALANIWSSGMGLRKPSHSWLLLQTSLLHTGWSILVFLLHKEADWCTVLSTVRSAAACNNAPFHIQYLYSCVYKCDASGLSRASYMSVSSFAKHLCLAVDINTSHIASNLNYMHHRHEPMAVPGLSNSQDHLHC